MLLPKNGSPNIAPFIPEATFGIVERVNQADIPEGKTSVPEGIPSVDYQSELVERGDTHEGVFVAVYWSSFSLFSTSSDVVTSYQTDHIHLRPTISDPKPFFYDPIGNLSTIGSNALSVLYWFNITERTLTLVF